MKTDVFTLCAIAIGLFASICHASPTSQPYDRISGPFDHGDAASVGGEHQTPTTARFGRRFSAAGGSAFPNSRNRERSRTGPRACRLVA